MVVSVACQRCSKMDKVFLVVRGVIFLSSMHPFYFYSVLVFFVFCFFCSKKCVPVVNKV